MLISVGKAKKCSFCGKEAKIIYICPECGNTYCYEHRDTEFHNCIEKKNNHIIPNIYKVTKTISKEKENEIELSSSINKLNELNIETQKVNGSIFSEFIFEKELNDEISPINSKNKIHNNDISIKKLFFTSLLIILLSTMYLYVNGSLSSIITKNNQKEILYDDYILNYSLIKMEYDELNIKYIKIESKYYDLEKEYDALKELCTQNKEFNNVLILENMKQITIPADSNTIFYYEIPFPGYVTVEFYSDNEIYTMIGSTQLDDVYYSRQPQNSKYSEYKFSVPVLPNINLMFVNPDSQHVVNLFFRVEYYCP